MSFIIDEKRMVEDNIFEFESKLKSPLSRFLDSTPIFVNYYHVDFDETTVDEGFKDVASILGFRSPIKYKKIENFPLYGIEQMVLNLQDADQGLDTDYSSECTILPGTIKPLENDFFTIPHLHDDYVFRITEIAYDTVMPDNFYRISYKLEYIDEEKVELLEKQTSEEYNCVLENIGTEKKCIIEKESMVMIDKLKAMYKDLKDTYMALFYDDRYNAILGDLGRGKRLYDPYMTEFINKHSLFNEKNDLSAVVLTDQFTDPYRRIKYESSVYRFIERREPTLVRNFKFNHYLGAMQHESIFYRWSDRSVEIVDIGPMKPEFESLDIFSDEYVSAIRNGDMTKSPVGDLIVKFVRTKILPLKEIPTDINEVLWTLDGSLEIFFFVPIILYIVRTTIHQNLEVKK